MKNNSTKKTSMMVGAATLLSAAAIACGNVSPASVAPLGSARTASVTQPLWYKAPKPDQMKVLKQPQIANVILSRGPNGEPAYPATDIHITSSQMAKIKAGHYTAAIALHYASDWSTEQIAGTQDEFKKLGIKVIGVTNANFKDSVQIADLEAIAAKKPNILVSIPVNAQTEATAYKKLEAEGVKMVFMSQPAAGMKPGKDYVSVVSADDFGNGMVAADLIAKTLHGKGNVAALYYAPQFFVTNERYEGFVARLQAKYPNIHLVDAEGFNDPNNTTGVASAVLTKNPNIQAMWVNWSDPAMGAVAAARQAGKSPASFKIITEDLANDVGLNMAQNSYIQGLGAQRPYDQGVAEAEEAALAMIGAKTHPFVAVPSLAVDRSNLAQSYQVVYHHAAPASILSALGKK